MLATVPHAPTEAPVTVVVSRRIKPERRADFEAWLQGVCDEATRFPGHQGVTSCATRKDQPEYVLIFRFDTREHLHAWEESEVRREWLERVRDMTAAEPRVQFLTGLEYWFTLPNQPHLPPPPRHKMALVTWLVVFPLSMIIGPLLEACIGDLPGPLKGLVMSLLLVLLMTYLFMPAATRLLAPWLFRSPRAAPPNPAAPA